MNIITNNQRVTRKIELGLEEATERREQKQKLKNGNFIQVYNRGWEKLLEF
ncbi:hypothetical protein [Providencia stuartii]|uniref:hypothetical protein n=1 Tax=Providencia stuartii TaxID=588 RepID=UPI0034E5968A